MNLSKTPLVCWNKDRRRPRQHPWLRCQDEADVSAWPSEKFKTPETLDPPFWVSNFSPRRSVWFFWWGFFRLAKNFRPNLEDSGMDHLFRTKILLDLWKQKLRRFLQTKHADLQQILHHLELLSTDATSIENCSKSHHLKALQMKGETPCKMAFKQRKNSPPKQKQTTCYLKRKTISKEKYSLPTCNHKLLWGGPFVSFAGRVHREK